VKSEHTNQHEPLDTATFLFFCERLAACENRRRAAYLKTPAAVIRTRFHHIPTTHWSLRTLLDDESAKPRSPK